MRFSSTLLFLLILSAGILSAQNTYFIKYKNYVEKSIIESKVAKDSFIPANSGFRINAGISSVEFLAKGIAKDDDILGRIIKISFDNDVEESVMNSLLSVDQSIEYIQKAGTYKMDFTPNDSLLTDQWALEKIKAFDAWDVTTGSDSIILAVIDTGIDYLHPDLDDKIFLNPGETGTDNSGQDKRFNNIDDDNNGFIDDYMGWDFTDRVGFPFDSTGGDYLDWDNDPIDENGHGTFIAGIAGAETNNLSGIAGVAPDIKLLNLRAFDPSGFGEEDDVAAAILYAVQNGAAVINMSFGDDAFSLVLRDVIRYAYSQDVVLVGSAGNSGSNTPHYPSGYSEVISVGNSTPEDFVASSSNYGSTLDMVAPGTQIVTTSRNYSYSSINGTSASAPFVSAAACLILSKNNFTNEEVRQILKSTSDDISESGWDERSGAGRLNLLRALTVLAPSIIKINHPLQDFATSDPVLKINATVLSAFFSSYSLSLGTGLNPQNFTTLIENGSNQFADEDIYSIDISSFPDTSYTLRLLVELTNGRTLEERVNFLVDRTPPEAELINIGPMLYGEKATIVASVYTNEPSVVRMYYKRFGQPEFNFITLDGFVTNNQFVSYLHYGFVPSNIIVQNALYEVYFEAENLVGFTTVIKNDGDYFLVQPEYNAEYVQESPLSYSLPVGSIFEEAVNFITNDYNEVLFSIFYPSTDLVYGLYKLTGSEFEKIDSVTNRLPRDVGDFNNNGLTDLLSSIQRDGFIQEQSSPGSFSLVNKYSDTTGTFWPVLAEDIDGDGLTEAIVVDTGNALKIWKINSSLTVTDPVRLENFTTSGFGGNQFDSPHAVITDLDDDGVNEIWVMDTDGDLFSYKITGQNSYQQDKVFITGFSGSTSYLTAGDYNGDGKTELAVLIHSVEELDIAPFFLLIILNFENNNFNVIYEQAIIDASVEFNSSFRKAENSIRFADLNQDGTDELIVFVFPYSYIFDYKNGESVIINYKETINSNSVFVGDLNLNGVPEIAFPTGSGVSFSEFGEQNSPNIPYNIEGYSSSANTVYLTWNGYSDQYQIYRGETEDNLQLLDSILVTSSYYDNSVQIGKTYFYSIRAVDYSKPVPVSGFSNILEVFSHRPGESKDAVSFNQNSVIVSFTEKVSNTIENLQAFEIKDIGYPNSVAPFSQFSYLLTYESKLPAGTTELYISGLKDLYRSPIPDDTLTLEISAVPEQETFFVSSFSIDNPSRIRITFNLDVDPISAKNTGNYTFEPSNEVTSVSLSEDLKTIYLNLDGKKPVGSIGKEYVLKINNLKSSLETGNIPISEGAGSYIVLTDFADDLSDVYVYPNPARISAGSDKIVFANLPQFAKITIWTLDGKKVGEVEEDNGDGGAEFNLKDFTGTHLSSGIYLYRVIRLDAQNNELEEKTGKFAVIR